MPGGVVHSLSFKHNATTMLRKILLLSAWMGTFCTGLQAQDSSLKSSISVAVVSNDLNASLQFYRDMLGMIETGSFEVPADFAKTIGLTDGRLLKVVTLRTTENENATEIKLATVENRPETMDRSSWIEEENGLRYLTIYYENLNGVMERIKQFEYPMEADTPAPLPGQRTFILLRDPDGVFVEIIGKL